MIFLSASEACAVWLCLDGAHLRTLGHQLTAHIPAVDIESLAMGTFPATPQLMLNGSE